MKIERHYVGGKRLFRVPRTTTGCPRSVERNPCFFKDETGMCRRSPLVPFCRKMRYVYVPYPKNEK